MKKRPILPVPVESQAHSLMHPKKKARESQPSQLLKTHHGIFFLPQSRHFKSASGPQEKPILLRVIQLEGKINK
jgi:hypothetical protein